MFANKNCTIEVHFSYLRRIHEKSAVTPTIEAVSDSGRVKFRKTGKTYRIRTRFKEKKTNTKQNTRKVKTRNQFWKTWKKKIRVVNEKEQKNAREFSRFNCKYHDTICCACLTVTKMRTRIENCSNSTWRRMLVDRRRRRRRTTSETRSEISNDEGTILFFRSSEDGLAGAFLPTDGSVFQVLVPPPLGVGIILEIESFDFYIRTESCLKLRSCSRLMNRKISQVRKMTIHGKFVTSGFNARTNTWYIQNRYGDRHNCWNEKEIIFQCNIRSIDSCRRYYSLNMASLVG